MNRRGFFLAIAGAVASLAALPCATATKQATADPNWRFERPKFIGKHYILDNTTMYIKREAYHLEFFAYEEVGSVIGGDACRHQVAFK
jgi:hypothetical protein